LVDAEPGGGDVARAWLPGLQGAGDRAARATTIGLSSGDATWAVGLGKFLIESNRKYSIRIR